MIAVIFCDPNDLPAVLAAGLGLRQPGPTPQPPEPVKLPEPTVAQQQQPQPEPPKTEEPPPAPANAATGGTEEPPRRRPRASQEKPATDPKTPAEALVPPPKPLGDPPPRQDPYGAISEEKPTDRPFRQRGPSVRPSSDGPPSINFDEIPENP